MDDCIDSLLDATVFPVLESYCGYWKMDIYEADRDKTDFTYHYGVFCFLRKRLGLANAPGPFQWFIDFILSSVRGQHALVYLYDVVICSKPVEDDILDVQSELPLLKEAGVTVHLKIACSSE